MIGLERMKVVLTLAVSAASVAALGIPTVTHAATTAQATAGICIPCLQPCGPVCFVTVSPVPDALPANATVEALFSA